jgi:hypothetical protein
MTTQPAGGRGYAWGLYRLSETASRNTCGCGLGHESERPLEVRYVRRTELQLGSRQHLEFVDVRTDYERVELIVGAVSAKAEHDGAIGPTLVDVDPLGVERVRGDDKVVASRSRTGELDGLARVGQEAISAGGGDAEVTGDDNHCEALS